jgi:hypothetical protein
MSTLRPSRRSVVAMLIAVSAASAGGAYFWTVGPDALIGKILNRRLPGVRIDAASFAALSRDVLTDFQTVPRRLALEGASLAASIVGIDALAKFKLKAMEISHLERRVMTLFLLGSNFLHVKDPKSDPVTYYAPPWPCGNPFAEFDR